MGLSAWRYRGVGPGRRGACASAAALLALALGTVGCRPAPPDDATATELVRLSNVGRAHLENRESDPAREVFSAAVELAPRLPSAWRNLARARLLGQDFEGALEALERAAALESESATTSYLTGIAHRRLEQNLAAIPHFEAAVRLDPDSAPARYQLAAVYQATDRHGPAEEQLREVVRLDPWHATAFYRLARYAAAAGREAEYEAWNREFLHLREVFGEDADSAEELEVSRFTRAEAMGGDDGEPPPPRRPPRLPVTFTDASPGALGDLAHQPAEAICLLDVRPDGGYTVARIGPSPSLLLWSDGRFEAIRTEAPPVPPGTTQCLGANYFDTAPAGEPFDPETHALRDLLLVGRDGVRLWQRTADGFGDVTEASGLAGLEASTARWVDVEHDGDLDLVAVTHGALELLRNRGDGTFRRADRDATLPPVADAVDVAAADLEGDVAVDLVVARGAEPTVVLRAQREGRFTREPVPPGPREPAEQVLLDDLDNDGRVEAVFVGEDGLAVQPAAGGSVSRIPLDGTAVTSATLLDHDNDGFLDLWVGGRDPEGNGVLRAWRSDETGAWSEIGTELGLDRLALPPVLDLLAADFDADGDTDLLVRTGNGLRFLRNDGGNARGQLKVRLVGTKTNPDGLGTRVEVAAGSFRASRAVGRLPVEIGLGDVERLDAVRTVWTNGVVDNQIDVEERVLTIVEKNVATGSCPFLYAWDGTRYRFVTDLLGNAPVGLPIRRGEPLPADPEEIVRIGGDRELVPTGGSYRLLVSSEFREVTYLDELELMAVDHPPGVEVHPTDKIMSPPFPPSELWALGDRRPLRSARAGQSDLTAALRRLDGHFAPPGLALPPPLRGMTRPRTVVLDFGPLERDRNLVLALTGWLQYGDASTNIALSQNPAVAVVPPVLEAETAPGTWVEVPVTVGLPAGKTKTILCSLDGSLPAGTRRLRLTTTFEVRWDRIALFRRTRPESFTIHRSSPQQAELAFRGFAELRARAPHHPTTPDPERLSPRPPWRTVLAGWSTRYGPVGELLARRDGRQAILNSGDAVEVLFDASELPPPPAGMQRSFFLRSVGWEKDGDHNVAGGDRVAPLPGAAPGPWRARFNTRYVPRDVFAP